MRFVAYLRGLYFLPLCGFRLLIYVRTCSMFPLVLILFTVLLIFKVLYLMVIIFFLTAWLLWMIFGFCKTSLVFNNMLRLLRRLSNDNQSFFELQFLLTTIEFLLGLFFKSPNPNLLSLDEIKAKKYVPQITYK